MESVNQFVKIRKWRSESTVSKKLLNNYWSAHDHCVCCCLWRKSVNCTKLLKSYLGGGNRIINCNRQTQPKSPQLIYLTKHMVYVFYKNRIFFSYLCSKKNKTKKNKYTVSMQYLWWHIDFKEQCEDHVAARLPRWL